MKKVLALLTLSLIMFSCGIGNAEKVAEQYHNNMKNKNFQAIIDGQLSMDATEISPKEQWLDLFNQVMSMGKLKKIEKISGFNSNINNGVTTVVLRYKYDFAGDTQDLYEKLILVKDGEEFEILGAAWNVDIDKLPMPK